MKKAEEWVGYFLSAEDPVIWRGYVIELLKKVQKDAASQGGWRLVGTEPMNESILVFIPNADHYGHGVYRAIHVETDYGSRWHIGVLPSAAHAPSP
jgi:hypothetical protein